MMLLMLMMIMMMMCKFTINVIVIFFRVQLLVLLLLLYFIKVYKHHHHHYLYTSLTSSYFRSHSTVLQYNYMISQQCSPIKQSSYVNQQGGMIIIITVEASSIQMQMHSATGRSRTPTTSLRSRMGCTSYCYHCYHGSSMSTGYDLDTVSTCSPL